MDALIVCSVVAGIGLCMGLAALVLAAEHQADIPELREEVDRLRSVVDRLTEADALSAPETRPIPITRRGVPTDTAEAAAVTTEAATRILTVADSYGRHAHGVRP